MTKHARGLDDKTCARLQCVDDSEARSVVDLHKLGDLDCQDCLRRMADNHEALAAVFRVRLTELEIARGADTKRCRAYDAAGVNPSYCGARDACCAGDPGCSEEAP